MYYKCKTCGQAVNMRKHKKPHAWNERYCKTCKEFIKEDHQCFRQPVEDESNATDTKKKPKNTEYFFFEWKEECQMECERGYIPGVNKKRVNCQKYWCGSFKHEPNLCVVIKCVLSAWRITCLQTLFAVAVGRIKSYLKKTKPFNNFVNGCFQKKKIFEPL